MRVLGREDQICLEAVEGWLELGDSLEAMVELERIAPPNRTHPDVLEARWKVLDTEKKWWPCLRLAEKIIQISPDRSSGWVLLSLTLHRLNQTEEAVETLIEIVHDFPHTPVIAYELARYSCCLKQWWEAAHWLEEACLLGNPRTIRSMALDDPDMKPLVERCSWERLSDSGRSAN